MAPSRTALQEITPSRRLFASSPSKSGQARASSSPPDFRFPTQQLRFRAVTADYAEVALQPAEVFDMAANDGEPMQSPLSGTPPERHPQSRRKAHSWRTSPGQNKENAGPNVPDAWHTDAWDGRACLDHRLSVIENRMDARQRMIADVVRDELQADMESIVRAVVKKMTSEVQEDVRKHKESIDRRFESDGTGVQSSLAALRQQVSELETVLREYRSTSALDISPNVGAECVHVAARVHRFEDEMPAVSNERAAISSRPQPSKARLLPHAGAERVLPHSGAERVLPHAGAERVLLHLGAERSSLASRSDVADSRLERCIRSVEEMRAENIKLGARLTKHDAEICDNAEALDEVQAKLVEVIEKERVNAKTFDQERLRAQTHFARQSEAQEQYIALAKKQAESLETCSTLNSKQQKSLDQYSALDSKVAANAIELHALSFSQETTFQENDNIFKCFQLRLTKNESDHLALRSDMEGRLESKPSIDAIVPSDGQLNKVDFSVKKHEAMLCNLMDASERSLCKHQEQLIGVESAFKKRDALMDEMQSEWQLAQLQATQELHSSKEKVGDLAQRVEHAHQVLHQHKEFFQEMGKNSCISMLSPRPEQRANRVE